MRYGLVILLASGLWSDAARADGLFGPMGRAALGAEIRALLLEEPEILEPALNPPSAFEESVNADLSRLEELAQQLFDPALAGFGAEDAVLHIAIFIRHACSDCARAQDDLQALVKDHDLRVTVHRMDDNGAGAALAQALELSEAPSYVLPDMMIQGHIPPVVLERYLSR